MISSTSKVQARRFHTWRVQSPSLSTIPRGKGKKKKDLNNKLSVVFTVIHSMLMLHEDLCAMAIRFLQVP